MLFYVKTELKKTLILSSDDYYKLLIFSNIQYFE